MVYLSILLAATNGVFIEKLADYLKKKGIQFEKEVNWIRCICHVINLCVEGIILL